jgi:hypothetical protein
MQFGFVHQLAKVLGELPVPTPGRFGGHLHGNRIEARVVSIRVASNQRFDLCCVCHGTPQKVATLREGYGLTLFIHSSPSKSLCNFPLRAAAAQGGSE